MRHFKKLLICPTLILFAAICSGQTATVKETLPDGSYIITINGEELRTVNAAKAREIQERKVRLEATEAALKISEEQVTTLRHALDLAMKDAELASLQTALEHERAGKFEALFKGENELRLKAENLLARRSRTTEFFDKPFVQIFTKLGIPAIVAFVKR